MNTLHFRPFSTQDVETLMDFQLELKNSIEKNTLTEFSNLHSEEDYLIRIGKSIIEAQQDISYTYGVFLNATEELIGMVTFKEIMRNNSQSANLYFCLSPSNINDEIEAEIIHKISKVSFDSLNLNRIQAALFPDDIKRIKILENNRFELIGLSQKHLKIDEKWQDQILYSISISSDMKNK